MVGAAMAGEAPVGDLDIRSGGVVAVDTASLRAAADRLEQTAGDLDGVGELFRRAVAGMEALPHIEEIGALPRAQYAHDRAAGLAGETRAVGHKLVELAAMFETVELRAERSAAEAAGDWAAVERIDARLNTIEHEHPWAAMRASWEGLGRDGGWASALIGQAATVGTWLGPGGGLAAGLVLWGLAGAIRGTGNGTLERGARLGGAAQPVLLREMPVVVGGGAPATLAAAAGRIPTGDGSRIRVERYSMPDGTRQYAVYVRGTTGSDDDEAFDMTSNVQLYAGQQSASYEAVLEALHEAGAERGDVVHAFGHSQGAMVASRLAVEGGFDTQTLVTFGSPVDTQVGDGTLSVAVRHRDDPIAALAGGGFDAGVGAPGSFVAERTADPGVTTGDAHPFGVHGMSTYEQTAAMLDASHDPRMDPVRDRLAGLADATSVTATEYAVARVEPEPPAPVCR